MSAEIPPPPAYAPPTARRRVRPRLVVGAAVVVVAVAAIVAAVLVPAGSSSPKSPAQVVDAYYRALAKGDATAAYGLLCDQQQQGASTWASEVAENAHTGTGIRTWQREGGAAVQGARAVVAGRLVLDDGETTAIHVLLLQQEGAWGVCTSDLGGVLPPTGTGGSGTGSGGTPT